MATSTFSACLDTQLRTSGSRPLVTFYDDRTGERVELSVVTYANWVAKTASLLQDELGLERGQHMVVDLPTHWLGPIWLGAAWSLGVAVGGPGAYSERVDLVVCGPARLAEHAGGPAPVVACSLLPLGARFAAPLPEGVVDFGEVVWAQPDAFVAYDPPEAGDVAWSVDGRKLTQQQVLGIELPGGPLAAGARLLTDVNPCSASGLASIVVPLRSGGGTVWLVHASDDGRWSALADSERADQVWRTS